LFVACFQIIFKFVVDSTTKKPREARFFFLGQCHGQYSDVRKLRGVKQACSALDVRQCGTQTYSERFQGKLIIDNKLYRAQWGSKNCAKRVFCIAALAAKIRKRERIGESISGYFFGDFGCCVTPSKKRRFRANESTGAINQINQSKGATTGASQCSAMEKMRPRNTCCLIPSKRGVLAQINCLAPGGRTIKISRTHVY